jgi:hypothetical protein
LVVDDGLPPPEGHLEHETIRARLAYTSKKPEILDKWRGGELFTLTRHVDGRRTMRAQCAIDENSPRVLRDVINSFDADWRPTDSFVRITVDEAFVGSSWYCFTSSLVECEGYTVQEGRISDRIELKRPARAMITHPIQADAWLTTMYDLSRGRGEMECHDIVSCSFHHRGATGPVLLRRETPFVLRYLGEQKVTVAAGEFDALHFQIGRNKDDAYQGTDLHPPYNLWVTADGDYVMLKAHVTGYMQTYYELTEYEKRKNFF